MCHIIFDQNFATMARISKIYHFISSSNSFEFAILSKFSISFLLSITFLILKIHFLKFSQMSCKTNHFRLEQNIHLFRFPHWQMHEVELYLSHVLCPRLQMQNGGFVIKKKIISSYSCNQIFFLDLVKIIDGFISENVHILYKVNYFLLYFCWLNKYGGSEQISNM